MSTFEIITASVRVALAVANKNQTWLAREIGKTKAWLSDRMSGRVSLSTEDIDLIAQGLSLAPQNLYSGELIPNLSVAA